MLHSTISRFSNHTPLTILLRNIGEIIGAGEGPHDVLNVSGLRGKVRFHAGSRTTFVIVYKGEEQCKSQVKWS
jgi:hypothetical protein